jgi:hypothetical protein
MAKVKSGDRRKVQKVLADARIAAAGRKLAAKHSDYPLLAAASAWARWLKGCAQRACDSGNHLLPPRLLIQLKAK